MNLEIMRDVVISSASNSMQIHTDNKTRKQNNNNAIAIAAIVQFKSEGKNQTEF